MPYNSIGELPPSVGNHLPIHAQEIYRQRSTMHGRNMPTAAGCGNRLHTVLLGQPSNGFTSNSGTSGSSEPDGYPSHHSSPVPWSSSK